MGLPSMPGESVTSKGEIVTTKSEIVTSKAETVTSKNDIALRVNISAHCHDVRSVSVDISKGGELVIVDAKDNETQHCDTIEGLQQPQPCSGVYECVLMSFYGCICELFYVNVRILGNLSHFY